MVRATLAVTAAVAFLLLSGCSSPNPPAAQPMDANGLQPTGSSALPNQDASSASAQGPTHWVKTSKDGQVAVVTKVNVQGAANGVDTFQVPKGSLEVWVNVTVEAQPSN